ncbi:MAG: ribosome-binding factor A [Parcubacteria group bacterium Gr01-1014_18]|nr:MAG: ribosome-binding factor A [Parcubacteria group bacterium Greene0416_36]TSC81037.1 MAG: ribosome-binding factor A [Parcubacteria group bacterium Gr01-1014_18]TSC98959.1 MAG: ribosome-binding factor A [Parcubacteria group bacterium Greene1014_20]TSD06749.1 MAG: ribosome-binding factor A [Parcubacteria group bacterium Greene0714_2]
MSQISRFIQKELSFRLVHDLELPRGVLVTIVDVAVDPDCKRCKVLVSVFPYVKKMSTLDFLNRKAKMLHRELRSKLRMKFVPNLKFVLDSTEEEAVPIETLINEVMQPQS